MDFISDAGYFLAVCLLLLVMFFTNKHGYPLETTTDDKYFFVQSLEMIGSISATPSCSAGGDRAIISRTAPGNRAYRDERWFSNELEFSGSIV